MLSPRVVVFIGKWASDQAAFEVLRRSIPFGFMNRQRSLSNVERVANKREVIRLVCSSDAQPYVPLGRAESQCKVERPLAGAGGRERYTPKEISSMALSVRHESIGKKMNRLLIYSNGSFIGEYERSQDADIERKIAEIDAAESTLLSIFEKHGKFCVRWNGERKQKSIRVNDIEVGVIPKSAWRTPSWRK